MKKAEKEIIFENYLLAVCHVFFGLDILISGVAFIIQSNFLIPNPHSISDFSIGIFLIFIENKFMICKYIFNQWR